MRTRAVDNLVVLACLACMCVACVCHHEVSTECLGPAKQPADMEYYLPQ